MKSVVLAGVLDTACHIMLKTEYRNDRAKYVAASIMCWRHRS
jgi:hypothetical protein